MTGIRTTDRRKRKLATEFNNSADNDPDFVSKETVSEENSKETNDTLQSDEQAKTSQNPEPANRTSQSSNEASVETKEIDQSPSEVAGETAKVDQPANEAAGEAPSKEEAMTETDEGGSQDAAEADAQGENADSDELNPRLLPTKNNQLYNTSLVLRRLEKYPQLKLRQEGKYYLKIRDVIIERHHKLKRNKRGEVVPNIKKETFGPIEHVVSRFCEDVMCISRASFLPLTTQGERHLIWVGKRKATHILNRLNGNGCYVINRFPGDIFLKDKQVMGVTLQKHMLARRNVCPDGCGFVTNETPGEDKKEPDPTITSKICVHMVSRMSLNKDSCAEKECPNYGRRVCEHLDVFVPEIQSFCTYNALQEFSNRLNGDLKNQKFVCKPAYLYKGYGFRFFHSPTEFQEFYHMTEGKETSRHDFMVQRMVDNPHLFMDRKFDIRAFLLVVVLRHRRVVSFVHSGFCRLASEPMTLLEQQAGEANTSVGEDGGNEPDSERHEAKMRTLICTYIPQQEKAKRQKMMEQSKFFTSRADRSIELASVFDGEEELKNITKQISDIGKRITEAIENKIWDCFGCFQLFSMDLCVDENLKVWLIEVNSHAVSEVDTLSPTQRKVVPAVIMEAIGLVMETTYKSYNNMRLRKSPTDEFDTTGFLFRQNFDFVFSTLAKKRMDYVWPKPPPKKDIPYYDRITVVDKQMKRVEMRKAECEATKKKVYQEAMELKKRRSAKKEEES